MKYISEIFKGQKADLEYLIELGKELKTQDNLGTRKPLIFRIQSVTTMKCTAEEFYDFRSIGFIEDELIEFFDKEIEKAVEHIKTRGEFKYLESATLDFDSLVDACNVCCIDNVISYYRNEWVYTGEFLTRKAAKEYLEKYKYRFNEPKIYIDCGVENKELVKLTGVLERLYEMNCKEDLNAQ